MCRLKNHNKSLVAQIKKLKSEKKSQKEKLEKFSSKEVTTNEEIILEPIKIEKCSNVKISIVDKGINTNPINLTTQKDANLEDVKRSSHVEVETSQGYEEDLIPKVNQEKVTSIRSKDQVARMPYSHTDHKI